MRSDELFSEFPPISTVQWKEKIINDLKGADYHKKTVWDTGEGFEVQPFYRQEDINHLKTNKIMPGNFPFLRGKNKTGNSWRINQVIEVPDFESAGKEAVTLINKGVDSLAFLLPANVQPDKEKLGMLLKDVDIEKIELNFKTLYSIQYLNLLTNIARNRKINLERIRGSVFCDPLLFFSLHGYFQNNETLDFGHLTDLTDAADALPNMHVITIDASIFHNSGATTVTEIGFALSTGVDYLSYLTKNGYTIEEIAGRIRFGFATGSNYFMEIAKYRTLRYLWANILTAYGLPEQNAVMYIHATSSLWNKTVYDPYVNMLRTTTENMSAILGGVDSITVLPFDATYELPTEMARRVACNQQLILKEESYFDKVADPAAGSYYIENLTNNLIQKAWELFLTIQQQGGYVEAFKTGFIQQRIKEQARKKNMEIAQRKHNILGVNQFPNIKEKAGKALPPELFSPPMASAISGIEPLRPYRGAAAMEALRYETDKFSKTHKRPVVWMFTYGNLAMRKLRSQFAENFFGCAGFTIIDNIGFVSVEEGIEAAKAAAPDIVVLCSSDEEYSDIAIPAFEALKNDFVFVVSGYPKKIINILLTAGIKHFIHAKSNLLDELLKFQKLLSIKDP